jgi:phospholipase C
VSKEAASHADLGAKLASDAKLSRRTVLGAAAAAGAVMATRGLPAWARPIVDAAGVRKPGSRPFAHLPAGHASMPQIKHIVVLMMENHSFDNLLGMVPYEVIGKAAVDGLARRRGKLTDYNRDSHGQRVFANRAPTPCQPKNQPTQDWNASHRAWDNGRNDGFVRASGPVAMSIWDARDLPFTYSLARHFPIGQRYFSSVLAQTYPNRRFMFTGTASGTIATNSATFLTPAANGTIWDRLDAHHIDWAIYYQNLPSWLIVPGSFSLARASRQRKFDRFADDVAAGRLPQFTFIDPNYTTTSEENPQDIQVGERFLAQVVRTLMTPPTWKHTALFINYDEHGGYYDHVPPPRAIKPDNIEPILSPGDVHGSYDRYGFRVPLFVVSPWARANYVSNIVQDHTSVLAFVEHKWNLPAMTFRDANAHPMTDYFDFRTPTFAKPPALAPAPSLAPGIADCHAHGLQPPLPPGLS